MISSLAIRQREKKALMLCGTGRESEVWIQIKVQVTAKGNVTPPFLHRSSVHLTPFNERHKKAGYLPRLVSFPLLASANQRQAENMTKPPP